MTYGLATAAALAGIVMLAGSNPWLAFGIGLLVCAAVLVLQDLSDRLSRIEQAVNDVRDHGDAVRAQEEVRRRSREAQPPTG